MTVKKIVTVATVIVIAAALLFGIYTGVCTFIVGIDNLFWKAGIRHAMPKVISISIVISGIVTFIIFVFASIESSIWLHKRLKD